MVTKKNGAVLAFFYIDKPMASLGNNMDTTLQKLANRLDGELYYDELMRRLYATDASVYRELPLAVATPKTVEDIQLLVDFAFRQGVSVIPRTAGTSLAGQCVGPGIVVDVSKHFNQILELNKEEGWVRVQPGVIRDELNAFLKPHGFFFGPNTSTANRAMIGGMVGNNSCGTTSIVYGSTRDHVIELEVILSDSSKVVFGPLNAEEFQAKLNGTSLENKLYQQLHEVLALPERREEIKRHYPKASIHRRNTGYAIDLMMHQQPFVEDGPVFNLSKLICGSEGTLGFITEIKIHVDPLPPKEELLICSHFSSLEESLEAVLTIMRHNPTACEMMDKYILDCTKENIEQRKNRFFLEGDPAAVLITEVRADDIMQAKAKADEVVSALRAEKLGYAHPKVFPPNTQKVWALRKAGLGVLSNVAGDAKPVACIEDTAVDIQDLPAYIGAFSKMMESFAQEAVYYAHAGAGELHLRPVLNLKKAEDQQRFFEISEATAKLVKQYQGSLSGEHGDGRVRAPFIPLMIGEKNYALLKAIKENWDPHYLFNPGKIVDAPPMNSSLRYKPDQETTTIDTLLDFSETGGILRLAEKCNGSGDCRKLSSSGGTMCPSYQATRDEKDTTRARANALREFLTEPNQTNPFDRKELKNVLDLCLSCKGCTSECPSNVDMSTLKSEFQYQYYKNNRRPIRDKFLGQVGRLNRKAAWFPALSNFLLQSSLFGGLMKRVLGIAPQRQLPKMNRSIRWWFWWNRKRFQPNEVKGKVLIFLDEFTNYSDGEIGKKAIQLLSALGYQVELARSKYSARPELSKGWLEEARRIAERNVHDLAPLVREQKPLIGIEPSAILGFRDEYLRLVREPMQERATHLSQHSFMLEEFLAREMEKGKIKPNQFTKVPKKIWLHGHCHQKSLSSLSDMAQVLSLPKNFHVNALPTGCCGMAGSFGYEKEHYDLSMQIGELVLFPTLRKAPEEAVIVAPGTSCRHQILDGTGLNAMHPVEVLYEALKKE